MSVDARAARIIAEDAEESERANRRTRLFERISAIVRYAILIAVGLVMIYPLLWLVGASFKSNAEIFTNPSFIPSNPTLDGFIRGWETSTPYSFGHFYWNTFMMVFPKVVGTAISCTFVAYGFARFEFPGKRILFGCLIAVLLLPDVVTRIPQYLVFRDLGWLDTYLPMWVPSMLAADAFFVFMLVQFLRAIPRDMEEAARIDGANTFQVLVFVVVPMLAPAIVSVCLFQFMWSMNDFLGPLIYISSVSKYPISLALQLSIDATETFSWNKILAMTVISLAPSLVVFFLAQKHFIRGVATGGTKV